jgi:exopolysaccharide biosynthesis predicted pyruvyltransferase EpsI
LLQALNIQVFYVCKILSDFNSTKLRQTINELGATRSNTAILFHGGGNFGDLYVHHQELRNEAVLKFPDYKIVAFPQTVVFQYQEVLDDVKAAYASHPDLTLVGRDIPSYMFLRRHFSQIHAVLAPDCAFMIGDVSSEVGSWIEEPPWKKHVLILARTDKESSKQKKAKKSDGGSDMLPWHELESGPKRMTYLVDDWIGKEKKEMDTIKNLDVKALKRLLSGFHFLVRSPLVVTDRLHGIYKNVYYISP